MSWGLGSGQDGAGYRDRLHRLCKFLLALKPEEEDGKEQSELARLQRSVNACRKRRRGADSDIQGLQDLQKALKHLERGRNGQKETEEQYLNRLLAWHPKVERIGAQVSDRQRALDRILQTLGIEDDGPVAALLALNDDLSLLERNGAAGASDARNRWKELVQELIGDWEWAYLQVLVRLARACLARNRLDPRLSACSQEAEQCLTEAIEKLERRGLFQPRTQGLYGLLAESILLRSKAEELPPEKRLELIQAAHTYARRAVEIDPESVDERRVLIEILSLLGDYEEVRTEAEVALNLDAGPEILRSIGASFKDQAASLRSPEIRKKVLQEAVDFFEKAKKHAESAPLDKACPLEQIETHGWAHYWLGLFEGERGSCDQADRHLRTAAELGFKPIESRVRLGWIYLEAKAYDKAGPAFRDAATEAKRWLAKHDEQAPGEDQPIEDLIFKAYLGAAFLALASPVEPISAGQAISAEPEKSIAKAEGYLKSTESLQNRTDLQSLLHEAHGRAHLARKEPEAAPELEKAVRLSPRSSAYCHLSYARLELSMAAGDDAEKCEILAKAREAYQLAVDLDPWGGLSSELSRLDSKLQLAEKPAAT